MSFGDKGKSSELLLSYPLAIESTGRSLQKEHLLPAYSRAGHVVHVDPTLIKPGEEIGFFSKVIWLVIGNLLLLVASLGSSPARLLAPQNQPVQDAILNGPSPWGVLSPGFLFKRSSKSCFAVLFAVHHNGHLLDVPAGCHLVFPDAHIDLFEFRRGTSLSGWTHAT